MNDESTTKTTASRESRWKALPRAGRFGLLGAVLVTAYLLLGFFAVPALIESLLPTKAGEALGREVLLKQARFNPITLRLELDGLAVREAGTDEDFVALDRLVVNTSSFSILRLAVLVDEVRLEGPSVRVAHYGEGEYNFSDIVRRFSGEATEQTQNATEEGGSPFPLVVNNFVIKDGSFRFEDRPKNKVHTVEDLSLSVPFTSTLPGDATEAIAPTLSAVVNGTPFEAVGTTRPFDESLRTEFDIAIDGVNLLDYRMYVPMPDGTRIKGGLLSLDMELVFERSRDVLPDLFLQGTARANDVALEWTDGRELAGFSALAVQLDRFSLSDGLLRLKSVRLDGPYAALVRGADGQLDVLSLLPPSATSEEADAKDAAAAESDDAPDFNVEAAAIEISGGRLSFADRSVPGGFAKTVTPIGLTASQFSTSGAPASFGVRIGPDDGERIAVDGSVALAPLAVNGTLSLAGADLAPYAPYYRAALPLRLDTGTVSAETAFSVRQDGESDTPDVLVSDLAFGLAGLALTKPGATSPSVRIKSLRIGGGSADLRAQRASVRSVTLAGGTLDVVREQGGGIDLVRLFAPAQSQAGKNEPEAQQAQDSAAWKALINGVALRQFTIRLVDQSLKTPADLRLRIDEFTAGNISAAMDTTVEYALTATAGRKGGITATGTLTPEMQASGALRVAGLALGDFSPYVSEYSALSLDGGGLSLNGSYAADLSGEPQATWRGDLALRGVQAGAGGTPLAVLESFDLKGVDLDAMPLRVQLDALSLAGFAVRDPAQAEDAASIASFTLTDASVDLEGRALSIASAALDAPTGTVVIDKDGIPNIARLIARATGAPAPQPDTETSKEELKDAAEAAAEPVAAPAPEEAATTAQDNAENRFAVSIGSFSVDGGAVHFRDESLPNAFSTAMTDFTLRMDGFDTAPGAQARLAANATLDGNARLIARGEASPTDIGLNPRMTVAVNGLNLTHFTPYSLKYIAYPVTAGKLFADLAVRVENRDVLGENTLRLARFDLGQHQKVEGAISAPVKLAVSLLRDGSGDIVLDVPIRGNLDDPQFRLGRVIFRAVMNLLVKAVTSPFALIGSMFGGGGEDLDALTMPEARVELTPKAVSKLETVAKALSERPGLRLELHGQASPAELPALGELRFQRAVRLARYNDLKDDGEAPERVEDVQLTPEEYADELEDAYEDAPFEKEENAFGFVKSQPVEVMEQLMRQHLAATEADLPALALERARAARDKLVELGADPDRIFIVENAADAAAKDAEPGVALSLQ